MYDVSTMRRILPIAVAVLLSPAAAQTTPAPLKSQFDALSKSMESAPADQRLAYNALFVTFDTFRDAHLRHEACRAAAGCAALQAAERNLLSAEFLALAQGQGTQSPPATPDGLVADDAALNAVFEQVLATLPDSCAAKDVACVSQSALRDVQRDWIRYRDALVTYEALRSPNVPARAWLSAMTRRRTSQLKTAFLP